MRSPSSVAWPIIRRCSMDALLRRRAMIAAGGVTPPEPPGEPEFYDYLVFDGTAYITTDYVPTNGVSFLVRIGKETIKAAQRIYMCACSGSKYLGLNMNNSTTSTSRYIAPYYCGSVGTAHALAFSTATLNAFLTPSRMGWGSTSYSVTNGNATPTGGLILGMMPSYTGQPYSGIMSAFKVYGSDASGCSTASAFDNYTPIATFRPCIYNGKAGMWYVEGNKFWGNSAGSGTLSVTNSI